MATEMHVYRGCLITSGPNMGVGNDWGYPTTGPFALDGFIPNQDASTNTIQGLQTLTQAGSIDAMLINNSNIIHNAWGNPLPGQIIQMITCNPNSATCQPTCIKYLGTTPSFSSGNYMTISGLPVTFGPASNLTQYFGTFPTCQDCDAGTNIVMGGCTDPIAFNYNSFATFNDGSCCYAAGCTNSSAQNYDPNACFDDGSCCWTLGCMDPTAYNYNSSADCDDGSCNYGWHCKQKEENLKFGSECVRGNAQNPGVFLTKQECIDSGCEGIEPLPGGPTEDISLDMGTYSPITDDFASQMKVGKIRHVYRNCANGHMFVPNQVPNNYLRGMIRMSSNPILGTPGSVGTTNIVTLEDMLVNNSNILHQAWGSPQPGQIIKFSTCLPSSPNCEPTCLEYLGTSTTSTNAYNYGINQDTDSLQPGSPFDNCCACNGIQWDYDCGTEEFPQDLEYI